MTNYELYFDISPPSDVFLHLAMSCKITLIPCNIWCFHITCSTLFTSIPCDTLWHLPMFCYILKYFLTSHDNMWSALDDLRCAKRFSKTLWYFVTLICLSIETIGPCFSCLVVDLAEWSRITSFEEHWTPSPYIDSQEKMTIPWINLTIVPNGRHP